MTPILHILKESGRLAAFEEQIRLAFSDEIEKVSEVISLPSVDVTVADNPDGAIPETGMGGFAASAHLLQISIDPAHPGLTEKLDSELRSTLAHELHHCARWTSVGYGKTLLEACISEGLADHFDIEVNGGAPKPWSSAVAGEDFGRLLDQAQEAFDKEYDPSEWFWGAGKLPRWTAYSIGFALVGNYLKQTGKSAGELVAVEAKEFVE